MRTTLLVAGLFIANGAVFSDSHPAFSQDMNPRPYTFRENTTDYVRQGAFYLNQHQDRKAIDAYTTALRVNPASALSGTVYNNLGVAYTNVGWFDLAIVSFQRALRLQPQFTPYAERLIDTYQVAGRLEAAQNAFMQALQYNALDSEAWFLLGIVYERLQQPVLAFEAFSKVQELEPASLWAKAATIKLTSVREKTNLIPDKGSDQVK